MLVDQLIFGEWRELYSTEKEKMRGTVDEDTEETTYTEVDIDNFVEIIFREVAEELGVKYKEIKDVLYGRNISFFEMKARIFETVEYIEEDDDDFETLMCQLELPKINNVNQKTRAERFISDLMELDIQDKITVLDKLSRMKINVPYNDKISGVTNLMASFRALSEKDKYEAMKNIYRINFVEDDE